MHPTACPAIQPGIKSFLSGSLSLSCIPQLAQLSSLSRGISSDLYLAPYHLSLSVHLSPNCWAITATLTLCGVSWSSTSVIKSGLQEDNRYPPVRTSVTG